MDIGIPDFDFRIRLPKPEFQIKTQKASLQNKYILE